MNSDIEVSVCLNAFNHQDFIDKAIKGILLQKTDFAYEVIIFDDFSNDKTRSIIRNYAQTHPSLIKLVLNDRNLYSINCHLPFVECWKHAKGKYIALCEGDDYWIDENKLQKQYDAVNENDVDICFTNAYMEYASGHRKPYLKSNLKSSRIKLSDVIKSGGSGMPTASIIIKAAILQKIPEWYMHAPVGDYFIQMLGAKRNGAYFLNDYTCVYSVCTPNSWTFNRKSMGSNAIRSEAEAYEYVFNSMKKEFSDDVSFDAALSYLIAGSSTLAFRIGDWRLARMLLEKAFGFNKCISFKYRILYIFLIAAQLFK